mgnify:CR=1 FL=1|jgi:hypothetical protein
MYKDSIRRFSAFFLLLTMWIGTIAVAPAAAQTADKSDKKDKQKKEKTAQKKDEKPRSVAKPLSDKENPEMIGKRKINGGTDKFFGWLGGSQEAEMKIGRQLSLQVEQQAKLVDDPLVTEYVNRVGQNIVLHSDAKVPFTIKVIDSDEVNAFALPGGYFYVNKGLILAADNEAELAGVMAHEIAHVAARHAMENNGKGQFINYGALAGIIFGGPIVSTVLQNGGGILAGLAMLKFSRGAEEEADRLGVQYLYASGYDPTAMATMFEKLASKNKKKPGSFAKLFTTHPQSEDRRDASLALVARFPEREEYIISTSEFQKVKKHLERLSNAKATIGIDIDEGETRPTLKRREPAPDATTTDGDSSSTENSGPPKLKRRGEPEPTSSPE